MVAQEAGQVNLRVPVLAWELGDEHIAPCRFQFPPDIECDPETAPRVLRISDFPKDGGNVVFIGLLKRKDARDYNEVLMLAKRGGKVKPPPTAFLDLRVADDSTMSPLLCRVDRYDYEPTGRMLLERGREDQDWFLIRGEKLANFPMVQVHKIKCLNNKEFFKS